MIVQENALRYLYREQRNAKQAYSQAEYRTGVTPEELDNLSAKLEAIDYCIALVLSASHETPLPVAIVKRALVEVKRYCKNRGDTMRTYPCDGCGFSSNHCHINDAPEFWETEEWGKEGAK